MSGISKVLVVDDDIDIAHLLKSKLSTLNYEVAIHCTAKGSREAAHAFAPHLIILDVMLGDGIGYQVARTIRKDPALYRMPILFQSVLDEQRDVAHAYVEGGDGYLTKPYTLDHLLDKLGQMGRLYDETERRCPITGLHSAARLRREIDHRLFRNEEFALFYVQMDGLKSFHRQVDRDEIQSVAASIGRGINKAIRDGEFYEVMPAHMGGGYFLVMTKVGDRSRFRKCLEQVFENTSGGSHAVSSANIPIPGRLIVAGTHTNRKPYKCATQMIDELHQAELRWKNHEFENSKPQGHSKWLE